MATCARAWPQVPDANGFRGLISNSVVKGESDPRNFSELGFCARETYVNNLVKYEVQVRRNAEWLLWHLRRCGTSAAVAPPPLWHLRHCGTSACRLVWSACGPWPSRGGTAHSRTAACTCAASITASAATTIASAATTTPPPPIAPAETVPIARPTELGRRMLRIGTS